MAKKRSKSGSRKPKRSRSSKVPNSQKKRASPGRKGKRTASSGLLDFTRSRKPELVGLLLILLGFFTALGMLSPRQGALSGAWLNLVWTALGWGGILLPLALLGGGAALLLRNFEDRLPLPRVEQVVGGALLYFALLVILHAGTGAGDFAEGLDAARQGRGGGLVGAVLLALALDSFGAAGTVVVLAAWMLIGLTFASGLSLGEMASLAAQALDRVAGPLTAQLKLPNWNPLARPRASQPQVSAPAAAGAAPGVSGESFGGAVPSPPVVQEPRASWELPDPSELLEPGVEGVADELFDKERGQLIEETLQAFGAPAHVVEINRGPTITQFGVEPDYIETRGGRRIKVKVSKIASLADDLALALAAPSIRVQAPVPGKGYVGVEVPNTEVSMVALRDIMESEGFQGVDSRLRIGLGQDVSGQPIAADLASMPHLLIAGTTGSGKSVCINAILSCLLLQNTPEDLKFVMVDPKRVELSFYHGIPHLLAPVVVDLERVVPALQWVSREMDERYRRFSKDGFRNIAEYNQAMEETGGQRLPYLVVVIDELADLMMLAPYETERAVTRLAQLARATGIHLVIATQRPSVDVVTGLIKANFPARIAFAVASSIDSRVILDQPGAERLLGRGDMLFQAPDAAAPVRMQGVFVSEPELARVIRYWKSAALDTLEARAAPHTPAEQIPPDADLKQAPLWQELQAAADDKDEMYPEAVEIVREMRRASISLLQRRLRIGYTRAARLIDELEAQGIVGPEPGGSQAREVLDYGDLAPVEGE